MKKKDDITKGTKKSDVIKGLVGKEPIEDLYLSEEDLEKAKVKTEGRKSWTYRADNLIFDKPAITGIVETNKVASRILLTGEVNIDYIGSEAANFLLGINDAWLDIKFNVASLFEETKRKTIRMRRFDPKFVWPCVGPKLLIDLAREEIARIGIKMEPEMLEYPDFYESMIYCMHLYNGEFYAAVLEHGVPPDAHFAISYFNCLLLLNKPGYMGVPVAEFFTDPVNLKYIWETKFRTLKEEEQKKVIEVQKIGANITELINDELICMTTLYEENL